MVSSDSIHKQGLGKASHKGRAIRKEIDRNTFAPLTTMSTQQEDTIHEAESKSSADAKEKKTGASISNFPTTRIKRMKFQLRINL